MMNDILYFLGLSLCLFFGLIMANLLDSLWEQIAGKFDFTDFEAWAVAKGLMYVLAMFLVAVSARNYYTVEGMITLGILVHLYLDVTDYALSARLRKAFEGIS